MAGDDICKNCKEIFAANEQNDKLADLLEQSHPVCECERCVVGQNSPGPVADDEILHRIIISPRDFDPQSGMVHARPFEKVFGNGLSVCRSLASDQDVLTLVGEGLSRGTSAAPASVRTICGVRAGDIRAVCDPQGGRIFCIYDQTVAPLDASQPPVPTHAGIFGRSPPPKTPERKKIQKDYAGRLRELFIGHVTAPVDFRDGLLTKI